MAGKIIITAAVCGSKPMKKDNPAVPYSPKEIIEAAVECNKAGAAIAHIHVRHPRTGEPSYEIKLFKKVLEGIREKCDMLVNLSTSGLFLGARSGLQRLEPIRLKPDICSLDIGSMNFDGRVFINSPQWGRDAARCMQDYGVKPELEAFDTGHIPQAVDLIKKGLITDPPYFQLCMGVRWGIEASGKNLYFMRSLLPPDAVWSVLGIGKHQRSMISLAIDLGGHVRVGFEDNLKLREGVLAKSNAEFVEMAVNLAASKGREPATSAEARWILRLRSQ